MQLRHDSMMAAQAESRREVRIVSSRTAWLEAHRSLDVTGDGRRDDLVIRAVGRRSDSLLITLFAVVDGDTAALDDWHSNYELIDPPFPRDTASSVVDSFIRNRLLDVLAGVSTSVDSINPSSFEMNPSGECEGDVAECLRRYWGTDSVDGRDVAAELAAGPVPRVWFSYGYETSSSVAWSKSVRRFLRISSCC